MRAFEFISRELCRTFFESDIELDPFLGGQVVLVWEQHLDRDTFGELDGLIQDDLAVVDVSSERLHACQDSIDRAIAAMARSRSTAS